MEYLGKFEVYQRYGGPMEGGTYYDAGEPVWKYGIPIPIPSFDWLNNRTRGSKYHWVRKIGWWLENLQYRPYRWLNDKEHKRQEAETKYGYSSVLSYRDTFYSFRSSDTFKLEAYPKEWHYE